LSEWKNILQGLKPNMSDKTIFRVVGGNSHRRIFNEYEIIPYTVIKETPRYYTVLHNGKPQLQNKRITSNSQWFEDLEGSLRALRVKIEEAILFIQSSKEKVIGIEFEKFPVARYVYVCKFKEENFILERFKYQYYTYDVKGKGWRIENNATRIGKKRLDTGFLKDVTLPKGRCYVYEHQSKPHNPKNPIERWVGTELDLIKRNVEQYAQDRIKYLRLREQKMIDWVRLFERKQNGISNTV